jgi:hypothetical protein
VVDPAELSDALDQLLVESRRLERRHARLADEKPYLYRDLAQAREAVAALAAELARLREQAPRIALRELAACGARVDDLDGWLTRLEEKGLPRRDE